MMQLFPMIISVEQDKNNKNLWHVRVSIPGQLFDSLISVFANSKNEASASALKKIIQEQQK